MATSPLELYESAYRLHYIENRIPDAVIYYQRLIKDFPDSHECGYAVIQLQKIKAENVSNSISETTSQKLTRKKLSPLVIVSLVLATVSMLFSIYLYSTTAAQISRQKQLVSTALNALGKISRNQNEEALFLLNGLKTLQPEAIAPYELCADIYRSQNKFTEARNEYTTYFKNNPQKKPTASESAFMALEKTVAPKPVITQKPSKSPVSNPPPEPLSTAAKKRLLKKRVKTATKPPPPPTPTPARKKKKGLYIVNPDSISYF